MYTLESVTFFLAGGGGVSATGKWWFLVKISVSSSLIQGEG